MIILFYQYLALKGRYRHFREISDIFKVFFLLEFFSIQFWYIGLLLKYYILEEFFHLFKIRLLNRKIGNFWFWGFKHQRPPIFCFEIYIYIYIYIPQVIKKKIRFCPPFWSSALRQCYSYGPHGSDLSQLELCSIKWN